MSQPRTPLSNTGATRLRRATQTPTDTDPAVRAFASKYECDKCKISYHVPAGAMAKCPLCAAQREIDELKVELLQLTNQAKALAPRIAQLEAQVNLQNAIRAAIEVCDQDDYLWLKTVLYQYKIDKSVSLKATHGKVAGATGRSRRDQANGFMTVPRQGDPEAHIARSMGGLAIAEYLDEAISTAGSAQAMGIMLKAWWKHLPGADQ